MNVDLIYTKTCPNLANTRDQLRQAFTTAGLAPHWTEWEICDPALPEYARCYGSPSIFVNGKDVCGAESAADSNHHALHRDVPPNAQIAQALQQAHAVETSKAPSKGKTIFGLNLSILPTLGMALMPKIFCPACWPAYAGVLSSLGVGFFDYTPYLLPAMLVFILIALAALSYRATQRRGYQPFYLGLVASGVLLSSKFYWDSDAIMWLGLVMLITASVWNSWPRQTMSGPCPACQV